MVAQPFRTLMSVEDYLILDRNSLEARYEFVDGYVHMLAGGTADHSMIGANLIGELRAALRNSPCRVFTSDMRVRLSRRRYFYPDASVSCDARDRGTTDTLQYPTLVVEVLSQSTEAYDRGEKFNLYRAYPTIQEYVLVNTRRQAVEVYRRASENLWTLHFFEPGDQVKLESLSISIPIAAIYEHIDLPEDRPDDAS